MRRGAAPASVEQARRLGAPFWVAVMVGVPVMAYGAVRLLDHSSQTKPLDFARWFVGAGVVHDLILAPLWLVAGVALARVIPGIARLPVAAAGAVSVVMALVSLPLWRGYGSNPQNSSVQPLDYPVGLATVLVGVWAVAAVWILVRVLWRRRRDVAGVDDLPAR